jgi:hypothetical protein
LEIGECLLVLTTLLENSISHLFTRKGFGVTEIKLAVGSFFAHVDGAVLYLELTNYVFVDQSFLNFQFILHLFEIELVLSQDLVSLDFIVSVG